jgi:hypothetical protein
LYKVIVSGESTTIDYKMSDPPSRFFAKMALLDVYGVAEHAGKEAVHQRF